MSDVLPIVLVLEGEWDIARREELRARTVDAIERTPAGGTVHVDMTAAAFIDSMTLSILLNAQRRLTRQGSRLAVRCTEGSFAHRTLTTAGLMETLNVTAT